MTPHEYIGWLGAIGGTLAIGFGLCGMGLSLYGIYKEVMKRWL